MLTLHLVTNSRSFGIERGGRVFAPGKSPAYLGTEQVEKVAADPRLSLESLDLDSLGKPALGRTAATGDPARRGGIPRLSVARRVDRAGR